MAMKDFKEDLEIYLEHIDAIQKGRFFKFITSKRKISFTIGYQKEKGTSFSENWPKEEDIKAFVVDFSQIFLTDKQPANFKHICNILEKRLKSSRSREAVRELRRKYNQVLNKSKLLSVREDEKEKKPERILREWLMAYYRHDSKEFRANIKRWEMLGGGLYKFMFIKTLINLLNPIFGVARIIRNSSEMA